MIHIPKWAINLLGISSGGFVTVLNYVEQFQGAITFLILFAVSVTAKSVKAWQEYRHAEEKHRQELRQDEESHKKLLNN